MLGVLVLQQAHDLTDEGTVAQLAFNIQWHYALNIIDESDDAKYMSLKTLWNFRKLVIEKQLHNFHFSTGKLIVHYCFIQLIFYTLSPTACQLRLKHPPWVLCSYQLY